MKLDKGAPRRGRPDFEIGAHHGAYGFRISGLDDERHLVPVPPQWPQLDVERTIGRRAQPRPPGTVELGAEHAELWIRGGGLIELSRSPLRVRFTTEEPLSDEAILHPYLGIPASIANAWLGRYPLHGGAFVIGERAWGLLGDCEAGKSATLAVLLRRGLEILSDDILVIERGHVFAGPRSVDLREETSVIEGGEAMGVLGSRARWRLRPGQVQAAVRLCGFVALEWGEPTAIEPVGAGERLAYLASSSVLRPSDAVAPTLLELASVPLLRWVRPRRLDQIDQMSDQLLASLAHRVHSYAL